MVGRHMPSADSGDFALVSSSTPSVKHLPGAAVGERTVLAALVSPPGHSVEHMVGMARASSEASETDTTAMQVEVE